MAPNAHAYLPDGLPVPVAASDGVSAPYWNGLRQGRLLVQRCPRCATWQFAAEWICHHCLAMDPEWVEVAPQGRIHSWERVWHPVHPALTARVPYLAVLVELPQAGGVRVVGNLLGDAAQAVRIGEDVTGVFEHHPLASPPFSLLQWHR